MNSQNQQPASTSSMSKKNKIILGVVIAALIIIAGVEYFVPVADQTSPQNFICKAPRYKLLTTHMPARLVEYILGVKPSTVLVYDEKTRKERSFSGKEFYEEAVYFLNGWDGSVLIYYNKDRNVAYKTCGHG